MRAFFKMLCAVGVLFPAVAHASNCGTFPYLLSNGTTADANQVMADFNLLLNCSNNNLAKNGANSDITSLTGLTTPLAPAQGGSVLFVGGATTGSANAQTLTATTPTGFVLTNNYHVSFIAGFQNTGAVTLSVNGTTAKPIAAYSIPLSGNEMVSGATYEVVYDGTNWELLNFIPKEYFYSCLTTSVPNVTGDGTIYEINANPFTTERQIGSGFNLSSGVFTAPITGIYHFDYSVEIAPSATSDYTSGQILVYVGSSIAYAPVTIPIVTAVGNGTLIPSSFTITLSAGTNMHIGVAVSGGTKNIGVFGGAILSTCYQGMLVTPTGVF